MDICFHVSIIDCIYSGCNIGLVNMTESAWGTINQLINSSREYKNDNVYIIADDDVQDIKDDRFLYMKAHPDITKKVSDEFSIPTEVTDNQLLQQILTIAFEDIN